MIAGRPRSTVRLVFLLTLSLLPMEASAHSVGKQVGDFYWGFLHPMTALESVFPMLALGLLAGQQGPSCARRMLISFFAGLLPGVALGIALPQAALVSWVNLASFVLLGLLLAIARSWPGLPLMVIAGLSGVFQGWGNTTELTPETGKTLFVSGLVLGGYLFIAVLAAIAVGLVKRGGWRAVSIRIVGSWISAIGLMVLALK